MTLCQFWFQSKGRVATEMQKAADMADDISAIFSKAVLILNHAQIKKRNREHCAVRAVLLTLWS